MSFKIALLLDPVTGLHHPAHQWVSVQAYLPFTPLTMLFINIVTIPLVEVRDGSLVPLQNESHRSQCLDRVLYGKPETIRGEISSLSLVTEIMCIRKFSIYCIQGAC